MTILPKEFEGRGDARGWKFRQIRRNKKWALYERSRGKKDVQYELVRVRQFASDKEVNGRFLHHIGDEYYPSASKWGLDGFTYICREAAEAAYNNRIRN